MPELWTLISGHDIDQYMGLLEIIVMPLVGIGLVCALIAVFFHRPIENWGFASCLIGYFAIGIGLGQVRHLESVWLAHLAFALLLNCAVLLVAFPLAYIMRRHPSAVCLAAGLAFALLFGLVTGFADAWPDSDVTIFRSSFSESRWFLLLSFPGLAGDVITNYFVLNGADWQGGEIWCYWREITLWNGAFWLITGVAAATSIYFFTQRYDKCIR